jgi:hypothetical protein
MIADHRNNQAALTGRMAVETKEPFVIAARALNTVLQPDIGIGYWIALFIDHSAGYLTSLCECLQLPEE